MSGNWNYHESFHSFVFQNNILDTRERILKKADDICRKVGFKAMNLDEISSQLSISKKTIYQYFEDKDALVDAVIDIEITTSRSDCDTCVEISTDAIDEIFLTMEYMIQDLNEMNPILMHDLQKFYPMSFEKISKWKNEYFYTLISNNLKRGISEGLYRGDIDIDILTKMRLEIMMLAFDQNVYPAASYDMISVNVILLKHFLHGIVTPKGHGLILEYQSTKAKDKGVIV